MNELIPERVLKWLISLRVRPPGGRAGDSLLQMGEGSLEQGGDVLLDVDLVVVGGGAGAERHADLALLQQVEHVGQDGGVHGEARRVGRVRHHREDVLQDVAEVRLVEALRRALLRRHVLQEGVQDLQACKKKNFDSCVCTNLIQTKTS